MGIELQDNETVWGLKLSVVRAISATNEADGYGLLLEQEEDEGWFTIKVFGEDREILSDAGGYMLDAGALRELRDALNRLDLEDD